ncbi:unnamed protein product [Parascedosporium putredinis]|uniref:Extracellular serine-rich protein n=1 Tax=Parascedosporium putredinis TaxID=1442378 RepID=A0A9P1H810_9PEZI|nr:unnamed protein product [Parascedosporium putredinis]CAI8001780.1 unnamed protein product [Parascedosporium putredinis]
MQEKSSGVLSAVRFARVIPVVVGGPQDTFVPNVVAASPGDIIQFQFSSGNHTVTQSTAEAPCQPLQAALPGAVHSGHIPFVEGQQTVGVFNMFVTNTNTMFLYCATGPHCRNGQVMVVNPLTTDQVVAMNKVAAGTAASTDGTTVQGGVVGEIPLASAAFIIPTNTGGPLVAVPPRRSRRALCGALCSAIIHPWGERYDDSVDWNGWPGIGEAKTVMVKKRARKAG